MNRARSWLVAMVFVAVAVYRLEQRVDDELETKLYESHRELLAAWSGSIALVWLLGTVPAGTGRYPVGADGWSELAGRLRQRRYARSVMIAIWTALSTYPTVVNAPTLATYQRGNWTAV